MLPLLAPLLLTTLAVPLAPPDAAEEMVRRLEAHHRGLRDLQARFVQSYRSGALGREIVERGTVYMKPPGRMLWEYEQPEKKTFVSDGKTFYFYVPADRQVIVRDQAGQRGVAVTLLSGQGGILAQFEPGLESTAAGGTRLRLTPRAVDPDVQRVFVELDDAARITSLEIVDAQGNRSRFRFEAIRENAGLEDGRFRFEIPKGVEVVAG